MEDTFKHLLIGGSAACIARTCCAPLELFRLQRQNPYIPNTTLRAVVQKEGFRYLWKGNLANCMRAFPQFAITWSIFQNSIKYTDQYIENSTISKLTAGGIAGGVSQAIIYPLETTKTLLSYQTNKNKYSGVLDCLRKTPTKHLYRGLSVGLAMHIPWNSVQLNSFSYFKDKLDKHSNISPFIGKLLCGAAAGVTSITMVYPTDLIRRRMQIQGFSSNVPKYNSATHAFKTILKTEGIKGLYAGLWTNYPKTLATFSIQYMVLDTLNSYFKT